MAVDIIAALRKLLLSETGVTDYTTVIGGAELPEDEIENMPQQAIVLHGSGGPQEEGTVDIVKPRVDVFCYGKTYVEAGEVDRAVFDVLKHLSRRTINGVLLHSVACGGGPIQAKHAGTGWPIQWRSYQITASDIETF